MSGGQKQRIAIARAFLKKFSFSSIGRSHILFRFQIRKNSNFTIKSYEKIKLLVIAHRLSTIIDANKIILLHNGKIVEIDKHENLLKNLESIKIYTNYNLKKIMIKKILQHKYIQELTGWMIAFYIKVCFNTSLWYLKNDEEIQSVLRKKKRIIVIFWHNRLLMAPYCWNYDKPFKMLISSHRDGKIISNAVAHLGIGTIKGSQIKIKFHRQKKF